MTVAELRQMLAGQPDDMLVLIRDADTGWLLVAEDVKINPDGLEIKSGYHSDATRDYWRLHSPEGMARS